MCKKGRGSAQPNERSESIYAVKFALCASEVHLAVSEVSANAEVKFAAVRQVEVEH